MRSRSVVDSEIKVPMISVLFPEDNADNFYCEGTVFWGYRGAQWCDWQHACEVSSSTHLQSEQED